MNDDHDKKNRPEDDKNQSLPADQTDGDFSDVLGDGHEPEQPEQNEPIFDDGAFDGEAEGLDDPSLDDVSDFSADAEEFVDEDWEEFDDDLDSDPAASSAPAAKKKIDSNKLIIGGGGILAVAVFLFSMAGSPPPDGSQTPSQQAAAPPQAQQQAQQPTQYNAREMIYGHAHDTANQEEQDARTGFLNDPGAMDDVARRVREVPGSTAENGEVEVLPGRSDRSTDEQSADNLPMPAPIAAERNAGNNDSDYDDPLTPMASFDEPIPATDTESVADVMAGRRIPRDPGQQAQRETTESANPFDRAADQTPTPSRISAQPEQTAPAAEPADAAALTTLQSALENMTQRLENLEDRQEQQVSEPPESSAGVQQEQLARLTDLVATLQGRLNDIEKQLHNQPQSESTQERPAAQTRSVEPATAPPAPAPRPTTTSPAQSQQTHTTDSRRTEPVSWVLRAAQPGRAMVARQGADHDVRNIAVGDNLSGIGQIREITLEDGRWVVKGTAGRIMQ